MLLALSIQAASAVAARIPRAVAWHSERLADTGLVSGPFRERRFPGGAVFWDAGSSHVTVDEHPESGAFLLRGGYVVGDEYWAKHDIHATELSGAWGEFAAIKAAPRAGTTRVTVFADPAGSWPLFYGVHENQLVAANDPHLVALALGLTELSPNGAFELLVCGHGVGRGTTIEGVERLWPGERLEVVAGYQGLVSHRLVQRDPYEYEEASTATADGQVRAAAEALAESVAPTMQMVGRDRALTLQLSGGLDSRLTAGLVSRTDAGRGVTAHTIDLSDDAEIAVSRGVARRLGLPHRLISLGGSGREALRAGWLLTGGQVSAHAAAGNLVYYEAAGSARSPHAVVGGWPGDCLIGSYVPMNRSMLSSARVDRVARDWADKRPWHPSRIGLTMDGDERGLMAMTRQALREHLDSPRHGRTAAQRVSHWAMFRRQPAFSYVSPARLSSHVLEVTPLLARPYLQVLLTLSADQIIAKNFYRQLISHLLPELAGVPYAATGHPIDPMPVLPSRLPHSARGWYDSLPGAAQRRLVALGSKRRPASAAETAHWEQGALASQSREAAMLDLPSLTLDGRAGNLHVRTALSSLNWTREYLCEAQRALDRSEP